MAASKESATAPLLWSPEPARIETTLTDKFRRYVNRQHKLELRDFHELHAWSVEHNLVFYKTFFDFAGIRHHAPPSAVLRAKDGREWSADDEASRALRPKDLPEWFPGARLNYAENCLFPIHPRNGTACEPGTPRNWPHADAEALLEVPEAYGVSRVDESGSGSDAQPRINTVTWGQMRSRVARLAAALRAKGVKREDCIAHVSANSAAPIITFLAATSIGAIFSGLATDAGPEAIYRRLEQIRPVLVFTDDKATYAGKVIDLAQRVGGVAERLKKDGKLREGFEVVRIPSERLGASNWTAQGIAHKPIGEFLEAHGVSPNSTPALRFEPLPFSAPAIIVFSSGTTSEPKCITHTHGGLLMAHKNGKIFTEDLQPGDRVAQITTLNWIMWNSQVATLLLAGTIILLDGSPLYPDGLRLPRILGARDNGYGGLDARHFGCSPRWLAEVQAQAKGKILRDEFKITRLHNVTTTGAPLSLTNARFLYDSLMPRSAQLANISGGTDLAGCIVGANTAVPVYGNLLQTKVLGLDVKILDSTTGEDIEASGDYGELAIVKPFPNQPLKFWGAPERAQELHEKYMESYFNRYDSGYGKGCWIQGDFIKKDLDNGAFALSGRSDNVLNPSGIRFGSGDIYAVVEKFDFVDSSIAVGQRRAGRDDDETVLLFVKTTAAAPTLTEEHKKKLQSAVRAAYSARHAPKHVFQVDAIPQTVNLKKQELAVKAIINGKLDFKPSSSTLNPEALEQYKQYFEIEKVLRQGGAKL